MFICKFFASVIFDTCLIYQQEKQCKVSGDRLKSGTASLLLLWPPLAPLPQTLPWQRTGHSPTHIRLGRASAPRPGHPSRLHG